MSVTVGIVPFLCILGGCSNCCLILSFVSVPVRGYAGCILKALQKGFSEMFRLGGGVRKHIFFKKLVVAINGLRFSLLVLVKFQTKVSNRKNSLHTYPHYRVHVCFSGGGYPPPFFGLGNSNFYVSEKIGTAGELYKGKVMKYWGRTSLLMGSSLEW